MKRQRDKFDEMKEKTEQVLKEAAEEFPDTQLKMPDLTALFDQWRHQEKVRVRWLRAKGLTEIDVENMYFDTARLWKVFGIEEAIEECALCPACRKRIIAVKKKKLKERDLLLQRGHWEVVQ